MFFRQSPIAARVPLRELQEPGVRQDVPDCGGGNQVWCGGVEGDFHLLPHSAPHAVVEETAGPPRFADMVRYVVNGTIPGGSQLELPFRG